MAKKTTKAQKAKRIRIIYELMLLDTARSDILHYGSENWGVSSRTIGNYIKVAYELIAEEAAKIQEDAMIFHLAQIKLLANKAIKVGDKRLFFDVIRDRAKLLDLYPNPTNKNLNIDLSQLTNEQLERIANGDDPLTVIATSGKGKT